MSDAFDTLDSSAKLDHLRSVAARALPIWGASANARLTLLNISENATYRVDDPANPVPTILRVHRTGYHTRNAVRTELDWMKALHHEAAVATPRAIAGADGELIQSVATPSLEEERFVVMFEFIEGGEPDEEALLGPFADLGAIAARMHRHSQSWRRPAYFERLLWDFDGAIGNRPNWGDWRAGPGLNPERIALLERVVDIIEARLGRFGKSPERFGYIHADLRLANLLVDAGEIRVIDFDDSGLSWFLYDVATALTFMEERADAAELIAAWVEGYRREAPLSAQDEREIPTFLMLRRLTVLAWLGSHSDTDLARETGTPYTDATLDLAAGYLKRFD